MSRCRTRWAAMEARAKRDPDFYKPTGTPEQLAELKRRSDDLDREADEFIRRESETGKGATR